MYNLPTIIKNRYKKLIFQKELIDIYIYTMEIII